MFVENPLRMYAEAPNMQSSPAPNAIGRPGCRTIGAAPQGLKRLFRLHYLIIAPVGIPIHPIEDLSCGRINRLAVAIKAELKSHSKATCPRRGSLQVGRYYLLSFNIGGMRYIVAYEP